MELVRLRGLERRYGEKVAFRSGDLSMEPGVIGLLGANGAGKSTLLHVLLGLLAPSAGSAEVLGLDVRREGRAIRARVGYLPENDSFVPGMSAHAFVALAGELSGLRRRDAVRRAHELLGFLGVDESRYRGTEEHSTGMKQRIKLAQALVHDPELLILDEPTNGLDPQGRRAMLDLIARLAREEGRSVLISSHLLEDVGSVSDSLVILEEGRVVAAGRIDLLRREEGFAWLLRVEPRGPRAEHPAARERATERQARRVAPLLSALRARGWVLEREPREIGSALELVVRSAEIETRAAGAGEPPRTRAILEAFASIEPSRRPLLRHLSPWRETLDELFARLVGHSSSAWVGEEDLIRASASEGGARSALESRAAALESGAASGSGGGSESA